MNKLFLFYVFFTGVVFAKAASKIITIGGPVSEIVCALDHCSHIIAVDSTSLYPPQLGKLPQLGYYRQINAESIYQLASNQIIMLDSTGPEREVEKLEELQIPIVSISSKTNLEGAIDRITSIGRILDKEKKANQLIEQLKVDLATAQKLRENLPTKLKILFVYSRGKDKFLGAGKETAAESMFSLLNFENAYKGQGYKQLSSESLLAMNPDIIVFPKKGNENISLEAMGERMPGLPLTKAYKTKSFILVDDLKFMGFTHRLGQGAQELVRSIQELSWIN